MEAYFDCFSGISGDMTLGAMVDLGVPVAWLKEEIGKIPLEGFDITAEKVVRKGITATNLTVSAEEAHHHRHYSHIREMVEKSPFSEKVRETALAIFLRIAEAEAKIHGTTVERVHFHEVGAIDAIVDVVGTALCVEYLGLTRISASRIALGSGFARCAHGRLPVPVPAVLEILKGIPVHGANIPHELVTPTGAGIIATLAESFGAMPEMVIGATGYGSGKREHEASPNLLRVITGSGGGQAAHLLRDRVSVVETAIDDMNPELFGHLMERLFSEGALDVCLIPMQMKKGRPGTKLQVVCPEAAQDTLARRILTETTSLGVRHYTVNRTLLKRRAVTVESPFGPVKAKEVTGPDGEVRVVPEYDAAREIALREGVSLRKVYETLSGRGGLPQ